VHAITGSSHDDAFASSIYRLKSSHRGRRLYAHYPGATASTPPNPYTVNLADNLSAWASRCGIAALHGPRVATFEDLRIAAGLVAPVARLPAAR
jgi:hypothetical protein